MLKTPLLFIGVGEQSAAYSLDTPEKRWERPVLVGFWGCGNATATSSQQKWRWLYGMCKEHCCDLCRLNLPGPII